VEEVQKNAIIFLNCLPGGGATAATTAKSTAATSGTAATSAIATGKNTLKTTYTIFLKI